MFTPFIAPITKKQPPMPLRYGYEIEGHTAGHPTRLVVPPLLSNKISLNPTTATNKWIFIGTRIEIIEWMRNNTNIIIENSQWTDSTRPVSFHTQEELVIDLLQYSDPEQSTYDYVKSYFVADYTTERMRVEIRPKIEKQDYNTFTLCRVIVNSGITLGDIVDDLETRWTKPAPWLITQVGYHVVLDKPGPEVVLSTDAPTSIVVNQGSGSQFDESSGFVDVPVSAISDVEDEAEMARKKFDSIDNIAAI